MAISAAARSGDPPPARRAGCASGRTAGSGSRRALPPKCSALSRWCSVAEPLQQHQVAGTRPLAAHRPAPAAARTARPESRETPARRPRRSGARHARVEEPDDRAEHPVGRAGVAAVQPQHPPGEADHDGAVGVGEDPVDVAEAEQLEPVRRAARSRQSPWSPPATETATRGAPCRANELTSEVRKRRPVDSQR